MTVQGAIDLGSFLYAEVMQVWPAAPSFGRHPGQAVQGSARKKRTSCTQGSAAARSGRGSGTQGGHTGLEAAGLHSNA